MRTTHTLAMVPSLDARRQLIDAIKAEARLQGMSMATLADRAKVRLESVSRLPNRKDVGYDTLWRLAAALGFSIGLTPPEDYAARLERGLIDPAAFPGFKD